MPISTRSNGQTIDETWFNILKTEIEALQASRDLIKENQSIEFEGLGYVDQTTYYDNFMYYQVTRGITITAARLYAFESGTSGSYDMDIKRKRGAGSWESIFTTRPGIPYTAGDNSNSDTGTGATAAVIDSTKEQLLAGDVLKLDILSVPVGAKDFILSLYYEPTGA